MYLMVLMDWFSRYVLTWELCNTLEVSFCTHALERALEGACPVIFNADQGTQFTSAEFTGALLERDVRISMDGRDRALDNVFIERLWRSVKYEDIHLHEYADGRELHEGLSAYFRFCNHEPSHDSLGKLTPACLYASG